MTTVLAREQFKRFSIAAGLFTVIACFFFWPVLRPGAVLLPTAFCSGFAAFFDAENHESAQTPPPSSPIQMEMERDRYPWHPLYWDALAQYYPWRVFGKRNLLAGRIPLWNPHQFCGSPFVANGQSSIFYPLNMLFWLGDPARVFGYSAVLHAILAVLGAFVLGRNLGMSDSSAFVCGIAFAFNGFTIAWLELPTLINAAAWMPWIVVAARRLLHVPTIGHTLLLSGALGIQLLSGHAQVSLLTIVALALYVMCEWISESPPVLGLPAIGIAGVPAFLLAAVQNLPTFEFSRLGHRTAGASEQGYIEMTMRALKPAYLIWPGSPFPNLDFNPESTGYIGITILMFSIIGAAALRSRKNPALTWIILAVIGALISIGFPLVARPFYFYVPGVSRMGGFGRATFILSFALAILAGFGCENICRRSSSANFKIGISVLIAAIISADMYRFCWLIHRPGERDKVYPRIKSFSPLLVKSKDRRILFLSEKSWPFNRHPLASLPQNGPMVYGFSDVQGYDSLQSNAYRTLMFESEGGMQPAALTNGNLLLLYNIESPILPLLGVKYIVSPFPLRYSSLIFRHRNAVWIYELKTSTATTWSRPSVNAIRVRSREKQDNMWLVPEAYFPGWHAWSESRRLEVKRVFTSLAGVISEANAFSMVYAPVSFLLGGFLTFVSLAGISSYAVGTFLRKRSPITM